MVFNSFEYNSVREIIKSYDYDKIGETVMELADARDDIIIAAVSLCRRRFRKNDIILIDVLDEENEGSIGVVFTEDALYHWNESFQFSVKYADIVDVDFDDAMMTVYIQTGNDNYALELTGDEDEYYPRYMYNFLMEIVDGVKNNSNSAG